MNEKIEILSREIETAKKIKLESLEMKNTETEFVFFKFTGCSSTGDLLPTTAALTLVAPEELQHILPVLNTTIHGWWT